MLIEAFLGRLVVIRGDHQRAIGTGRFGELRQPNRFGRAVGAGSGDDLHPASRLLADDGDDPLVLVVGDGWAFPGGSHRADAIGPLLDLPVDQFPERRFIDRAIAKRGHQCNRDAGKLHTLRTHISPISVIVG